MNSHDLLLSSRVAVNKLRLNIGSEIVEISALSISVGPTVDRETRGAQENYRDD
jgi:hypothetical protein